MPICTKCGIDKDCTMFYKAGAGERLRGDCKTCVNAIGKLYRQKRQQLCPEARRAIIIKNKYGLSSEDYQKMIKEQDNVCKICGKPEAGYPGKLSVDHNHETGKIRGLLCHGCNCGIGFLKEDPEILKRAIAYLRESND